MFNVNNTNTRHEFFSKLTIKATERCHRKRPGVFIFKFEHVSHRALVFLSYLGARNCIHGMTNFELWLRTLRISRNKSKLFRNESV